MDRLRLELLGAARATAVHLLGDPPFEQPSVSVVLAPLTTAEEAEIYFLTQSGWLELSLNDRETGLRLRMARLLSFLACCQVDLGQPAEALVTIRRTADLGAPTTPRFSSEILTIRGSALRAAGNHRRAADEFQRAFALVAAGNSTP